MITEDYVSFEVAKLLKEKGFNEICRAFWKVWDNHITIYDCSSSHLFEYCNNSMLEQYNDDEELNIAAPTIQMAMKWLREKKKFSIIIQICFDDDRNGEPGYFFEIWQLTPPYESPDTPVLVFDTYEEDCEAAIKHCLENFI